jgi:uncharacterized membrane protein YcfT
MYLVSVMTFYVLLRRSSGIELSWLFEAALPIFGSAVAFSLTRNPFISLLICAMIGVLVILARRNSMSEAFNFLKNLRKV